MGTVMNGKKWYGACINNKIVEGIAKNGSVFFRKLILPHFLVIYKDNNEENHSIKFYNEDDLYNFISDNTNITYCKISSVNNIPLLYNTYSLFYGCYNLREIDISELDTSNAVDMGGMFEGCSNLISINVNNINTENVTNMSYMFYGCSNLTVLNLSSFLISGDSNLYGMFAGCTSLEELDIRNMDISQVFNIGGVFMDVPNNCLIIVKDQNCKNSLEKIGFTNVNIYQ